MLDSVLPVKTVKRSPNETDGYQVQLLEVAFNCKSNMGRKLLTIYSETESKKDRCKTTCLLFCNE